MIRLRILPTRTSSAPAQRGGLLCQQYPCVLTLAGCIHSDLAAFLHEHSRVPHVLTRYDDAVTHGLCHF